MSEGFSSYTCTPRQVKKYIIRCVQAGLVPFVQSSPGMGKSAIVRAIAEEYGLELIDHRLSTSPPEDLSGLPKFNGDTATYAPFDMFPVEGTPIPEGKNGWLLFLDEFNSANKMVQAAAYKLVLDKMVGLRNLHPNVAIVCAGNLTTDRAIVNPLGTAMQSRLVSLEMVLSHEEFMEDVAYKYGWDSRIIAYLNYKKSALHDFRPDHNDKTFCSPRTWEFMNRLIQGQTYEMITDDRGNKVYSMELDAPLFAGTITSGVAVDFINFTKVYLSLPKVQDIVKDPEGAEVPNDSATRYATITHLMEHADEDNLNDIMTYMQRFPSEFKVMFFRGLLIRDPKLRYNKSYIKNAASFIKDIYEMEEAA